MGHGWYSRSPERSRRGFALSSTEAQPLVSFYQVQGHPGAHGVHSTQIALAVRIPLFGGPSEPIRRFSCIPFDSKAVLEHHAKIVLRLGIPLLRRFTE